ncbi:hypothetical protein LTR78_010309 [Recurvomyces mirabilis]|uniref:IBR domain-containing protein n=1 Tax=Recurvomyces mirabilis TaxID=574656 RepID=A0AAE0TQ93_9PEZI|nr:hypothetical protein LTR78_010309 [Recurvomyces mirabilis]KAK5149877.1 hypothetical protein LTS14_010592 [Recurvomyces mirabilis]
MALWEGAFTDMDPITLSTIIQIQLQDSQELATKTKGKQREDTVNDGELAFQMYVEELTNIGSMLSDRKMAQSLTTAVLLDGHLIQREHELEDQVLRDRQFARSIQGDETLVNPISKPRYQEEHHEWVNDEYLPKLAPIYMREPVTPSGTTPPPLTFDSDSDGTIVESSQWAATREKKRQPKKGHCIACGEDMDFFDVARVPCDHEYCRPCIGQLFELSITDESLFPPRCDGKEIPLAQVRLWLPSDLAMRFESKYAELSTKNRTYCHDPRCNQWIDQAYVDHDTDVGTCTACKKTTCIICKGFSHTGDCPDDSALQQLVDTANMHQWQRCYQFADVVLISATSAVRGGRPVAATSGKSGACTIERLRSSIVTTQIRDDVYFSPNVFLTTSLTSVAFRRLQARVLLQGQPHFEGVHMKRLVERLQSGNRISQIIQNGRRTGQITTYLCPLPARLRFRRHCRPFKLLIQKLRDSQ